MTEKELEAKAKQYANKTQFTEYDNSSLSESLDISEEIKQSYIASAKENGVIWHDLRKDSNDLPTWDNTGISDYVITDRGVGYYNSRVKSWWVKNDYALTEKIIAWCEIPKFEDMERT